MYGGIISVCLIEAMCIETVIHNIIMYMHIINIETFPACMYRYIKLLCLHTNNNIYSYTYMCVCLLTYIHVCLLTPNIVLSIYSTRV